MLLSVYSMKTPIKKININHNHNSRMKPYNNIGESHHSMSISALHTNMNETVSLPGLSSVL